MGSLCGDALEQFGICYDQFQRDMHFGVDNSDMLREEVKRAGIKLTHVNY